MGDYAAEFVYLIVNEFCVVNAMAGIWMGAQQVIVRCAD